MKPTISTPQYDLYHADCLDVLPTLSGIDAVIADPPYGTTACKWDSVIPFLEMWAGLKIAAKPNAAIVLFGSQPFTSALIMSNPNAFKYEWIWTKDRSASFVHAKNMPLKTHENLIIFSEAKMGHLSLLGSNRMIYNPQGLIRINKERTQSAKTRAPSIMGVRPSNKDTTFAEFTNYPKSNLKFPSEVGLHPTQKPVALMKYLVSTYSDKEEIVLDFTTGSGTTGIACIQTGRRFIGIEREEKYFEIAAKRLEAAAEQGSLFEPETLCVSEKTLSLSF